MKSKFINICRIFKVLNIRDFGEVSLQFKDDLIFIPISSRILGALLVVIVGLFWAKVNP